jgi:hypothetical protein
MGLNADGTNSETAPGVRNAIGRGWVGGACNERWSRTARDADYAGSERDNRTPRESLCQW